MCFAKQHIVVQDDTHDTDSRSILVRDPPLFLAIDYILIRRENRSKQRIVLLDA